MAEDNQDLLSMHGDIYLETRAQVPLEARQGGMVPWVGRLTNEAAVKWSSVHGGQGHFRQSEQRGQRLGEALESGEQNWSCHWQLWLKKRPKLVTIMRQLFCSFCMLDVHSLFCFVYGTGVCTCKGGALPLEPYLQSILLWFYYLPD
jgi:hypothetical protein